MAFVSVTRLRIRSFWTLPAFAVRTQSSIGQVRRAAGFLAGSLLLDRRRTFWTLTLWEGEVAMRAYMIAGAHRAAMARLADWCDEASVVHWTQPDAAAPAWTVADARMRGEGRPSKVRNPSPDHQPMTFAAPRVSAHRVLTPLR